MEEQLWIACSNGTVEEVIKLLQDSLNINWQDSRCVNQQVFGSLRTPFWIACHNGRTEIVKLFLNDERTDINKADKYGWTPLYITCYEGHIEIVKLLLNDKRIDIVNSAKLDWTPLSGACWRGHIEIMKLLLNDKRIDINEPDKYGETPFYIACKNGNIEIVKLLLNDERVDVNKAKNDGATPLHFIFHFEIVQYILGMGRGANLNIKDNNGKTAIDIARENEKVEIAEWENEVEFQEKKRECGKIVELLESFKRNPNETRIKLRIQLGLADKDAVSIFSMVILFSDAYLDFKKKRN